MPLPFILGGLAVATAATGVKKAYDGYQDKSEANAIVAKAKANYEGSRAKLESANNDLQNKLNNLGELYLKVGQDFNEFQTIAQKLIEQTDASVAKEIKAAIPEFKIRKIQTVAMNAVQYTAKVAGAATGGAAAAYAVYGGVMALAAASTGTPIAALSGVAAYNATLAAIGGGSLAAGGLGMAGGTMILGGVVAAPVIAVAGWAFASHAADALENAKKIRNEVYDFVDQSRKTINELQYAEGYIDTIHDSMQEIYAQFQEYLDDLKVVELMVRRKSTDEIAKNEEIIRIVENGYALAAILADIISTPIFRVKTLAGQPVVDEDGMAVFETTPNGNMALNDLEMREVLKGAESRI